MIRTYSELATRTTFEDRFFYLALRAEVGGATFGFDRFMNQQFYRSREWRQLRNYVISRDSGCDLGMAGYEIHSHLYIHHMNPMTRQDLSRRNEDILNPEFLITTTHRTHNAIHYGDEKLLAKPLTPREAGDTKLW